MWHVLELTGPVPFLVGLLNYLKNNRLNYLNFSGASGWVAPHKIREKSPDRGVD
jgi:hypothetical protein